MYQRIINIEKTNKIPIEKLYNMGVNNMGTTLNGHESVDCKHNILNVKQSGMELKKYYVPVKRVIKHNVSKPKWKLEDEYGNIVYITNDHSLMVMRNFNIIKVKPQDVYGDDKLVSVIDDEIFITDIVCCEQIGYFENENVYDIEVNDETHTFVANDILVHNSIYTSYDKIINVTDWFDHDVWRLTQIDKTNDLKTYTYVSKGGYTTQQEAEDYFKVKEIDTSKYDYHIDTIEPSGREFCLTLDRVFMNKFLKDIHKKYGDMNGVENLLDFELEAYNEAGIWLAKKKYIKNTTWTEPNVYYDSCSKIKATGVEIAQTSSSPWVKKQLTDLVRWIFKEENFVFDRFVTEVTKVKKQFIRQSIDTISINKGMNKYGQYVLNDVNEIELQPKAMVTVQGASLYNWMLNNNEKYKRKYSMLMDSDKLCVVYIKPTSKYTYWKSESFVKVSDYVRNPSQYKLITNRTELRSMGSGKPVDVYTDVMSLAQCESFSYPSGQYPMDMAGGLEIDMNRMFELLILNPINRIVEAMGYSSIDISMTFETALW